MSSGWVAVFLDIEKWPVAAATAMLRYPSGCEVIHRGMPGFFFELELLL